MQGVSPELPPLVSVITAVYNGGVTLERAIKSVISQTLPRMEFIIIDGGSTDCSIELLRKYDNSIDYWISEPDKGIYDALNKGIALATGEWLYFLGADDMFVDDNVLKRFLPWTHKSQLIYGNVVWANTGRVYDGKFSKYKLCRQNICQQAIFYKRELFRTIGKFEIKYSLYADWVFNMRCFAANRTKPIFIDVSIAVYCEEGISTRNTDRIFQKDQKMLIKTIFGYWYFLCAMTYYKIGLNQGTN